MSGASLCKSGRGVPNGPGGHSWVGVVPVRWPLRAALAAGRPQAEISRRLDRTREMLRRDAMTAEQREALRLAEAERKRRAKGGRKGRRS